MLYSRQPTETISLSVCPCHSRYYFSGGHHAKQHRHDEHGNPPVTETKACESRAGTISSDGGVFLLAGADKRLGLIERLAALFPDARELAQITHPMADILRERILAIACGYPDGNDLDTLGSDPAFKMA